MACWLGHLVPVGLVCQPKFCGFSAFVLASAHYFLLAWFANFLLRIFRYFVSLFCQLCAVDFLLFLLACFANFAMWIFRFRLFYSHFWRLSTCCFGTCFLFMKLLFSLNCSHSIIALRYSEPSVILTAN